MESCAGLVAAVSVTLVGQGWGGSGFALEGALHGQAELEGCEQSGSTGLSPPASLGADIPSPWKYA